MDRSGGLEAAGVGDDDRRGGGAAVAERSRRWLPWVAVVLSLVSLGLAMRKPEPRAAMTAVA